MYWGREWLVVFSPGKAQLVSFDRLNNSGATDVKMHEPVLEEKSSFKTLRLSFFSKLDWVSHIVFVPKTASKKIEALILSANFLSPEVALNFNESTTRSGIL